MKKKTGFEAGFYDPVGDPKYTFDGFTGTVREISDFFGVTQSTVKSQIQDMQFTFKMFGEFPDTNDMDTTSNIGPRMKVEDIKLGKWETEQLRKGNRSE